MARRRPPVIEGVTGADMPQRIAVFDPGQWAGGNLYQREQAWKVARADWVEKYKPIGLDPMLEDGLKPDEPFDPYGPHGERFFGSDYPKRGLHVPLR